MAFVTFHQRLHSLDKLKCAVPLPHHLTKLLSKRHEHRMPLWRLFLPLTCTAHLRLLSPKKAELVCKSSSVQMTWIHTTQVWVDLSPLRMARQGSGWRWHVCYLYGNDGTSIHDCSDSTSGMVCFRVHLTGCYKFTKVYLASDWYSPFEYAQRPLDPIVEALRVVLQSILQQGSQGGLASLTGCLANCAEVRASFLQARAWTG